MYVSHTKQELVNDLKRKVEEERKVQARYNGIAILFEEGMTAVQVAKRCGQRTTKASAQRSADQAGSKALAYEDALRMVLGNRPDEDKQELHECGCKTGQHCGYHACCQRFV